MLGSSNVNKGEFRPYLLFGFGTYTIDELEIFEGAGGIFGIGVNYSLDDNIEFDIGFHAKSIEWIPDSYDYYDDVTTDISGLAVTARYKF